MPFAWKNGNYLNTLNQEQIERGDLVMGKLDEVPKRRLSDVEKQMIFLEIEKSKIKRSRSMMLLNKGMIIFVAFFVIAIIALLNKSIDQYFFNFMILGGILILVIAIVLHSKTSSEEEKKLDDMINDLFK